MQIPDKTDPGYQAWVDALAEDAKTTVAAARQARAGVVGLPRDEAFMVQAAAIAVREPGRVPDLIRQAFEMNLEAAPAIAQQLKGLASA